MKNKLNYLLPLAMSLSLQSCDKKPDEKEVSKADVKNVENAADQRADGSRNYDQVKAALKKIRGISIVNRIKVDNIDKTPEKASYAEFTISKKATDKGNLDNHPVLDKFDDDYQHTVDGKKVPYKQAQQDRKEFIDSNPELVALRDKFRLHDIADWKRLGAQYQRLEDPKMIELGKEMLEIISTYRP
jgi:hypothetical protein